MDAGQVIATVLGSAALVEVIRLIADRLHRKDAVSDKKDSTYDQIEELRAETSEQFDKVDNRFVCIEDKVDSIALDTKLVMQSTKAQAYDRIRHLGMVYIRKGRVTANELKNYKDMYLSYISLEKDDTFLRRVVAEVDKLQIIPDDEE